MFARCSPVRGSRFQFTWYRHAGGDGGEGERETGGDQKCRWECKVERLGHLRFRRRLLTSIYTTSFQSAAACLSCLEITVSLTICTTTSYTGALSHSSIDACASRSPSPFAVAVLARAATVSPPTTPHPALDNTGRLAWDDREVDATLCRRRLVVSRASEGVPRQQR